MEHSPPTSNERSPSGAPRRTGTRSAWMDRLRPELLPALTSAILATVIGAWIISLWSANLHAPLYVGGDNNLNLAAIKGILEHGWYLTNHNLGAPLGQQLYNYPAYSGDSLYLAMIEIIGIPFSNPAAVENLFFLICFPLIALSAYATWRALRISVGVSIVCAVLFTLLPIHFADGEGHLFLGSYFTVPLGCFLVLAVFADKALFIRDPRRTGIRSYLTWRSGATVLACIVMGCSDNYYAVFTAALLTFAAVITFIAMNSRRALVGGLVAVVLVLVTVGLNGLPTVIYQSQHGKDPAVGQRQPFESDLYGLSLADLVLPVGDHRLKPFAELAERYQSTAPAPVGEGHTANLGLIATIGFLLLALALASRAMGGRALRLDPRFTYAALGAWIAFLIATVGGLGTIFAYVVSPQLRAWNRISIFIAFFALTGSALLLDWVRARIGFTGRRRALFATLLTALLAIGLLDQTTTSMTPPYKSANAEYFSAARFVDAIQHQLPSGSAVFQLPYVPFPENPPVNKMVDYDELDGYLHSSSLRWSYGQLKGLPSDWESIAVNQPLPLMLAEVAAAGFKGIYIDTFGYTDGGAALFAQLGPALGTQPLVSSEGRYYFYSLAHYDEILRARYSPAQMSGLATAALYPLSLNFSTGFYGLETLGALTWHWAQRHSTIEILNSSHATRSATFTARVAGGSTRASRLTIRYPEGSVKVVQISSRETPLTLHLVLKHGKNDIRLNTSAPATPGVPGDTRSLFVRFSNTTLVEPAACLPTPSHVRTIHKGHTDTLCNAGPMPQLTQ
jgi:hypothetical protein